MRIGLIFILLFLSNYSFIFAQKTIDLGEIPVPLTKNYYFQNIEDNRKKENFDGKVVTELSNKTQTLIFRNGLLSSFSKAKGIINKNGNALIFSIKSLELFEKSIDSKRIEGNFWLTVEFFSVKENEKIPLTEYSYTSTYTRSNQKLEDIKPIIKNGFAKSFAYFDSWFLKNNLKSEGLAKTVKVICTHKAINDADTIAYSFKNKLKWADFQGKKTGINEFDAAIFSSFGFKANSKVIQGEIVIAAIVQSYMVPRMSWVNNDARTDYALAHEQAHFDISFLISEEFRAELVQKTFSIIDWESEIRYLYLEYFRKLTKIQEKYDLETRHGLNEISQKEWLTKINQKIMKINVH
jgi:hypothetical protein